MRGLRRRDGRLAASVLAWAALGLCVAVVFELTCRVEDWVMYRMPITSRYTSIEDLLVHDADGVHGRRNAQFEKWVMNNVGTRGPDVPVTPAPGSVRVITVGASETFGLRESPGQEFPRQLEDSLNARIDLACDGRRTESPRFEVLNAAFAGMAIPTIEQDVRNRLKRLHPAIIVAYVSPSAYLEDERPVPARPDSAPHAESPRIERAFHPRALERVRDQMKGMLPSVLLSWVRRADIAIANRGRSTDRQFTSVPPERLADFDADLRHLIGTVRAVGATPLLVTHANLFAGRVKADSSQLVAWTRFYPRASGRTLIAFDSLARGVTLRVGADSNVAVADAAARLAAEPERAFADYVHFTNLGAAAIASTVATGVLSVARIDGCGGAR